MTTKFSDAAALLLRENAAAREALMLESLSQFMHLDGEDIILTEQFRLRMAKIEDYKKQLKWQISNLPTYKWCNDGCCENELDANEMRNKILELL